jgi:hypothetical protein
MFLCRAQADHANSVIIRTFCKGDHKKPHIDQPNGDEADFAVIEPIIFALKRCVPIEADCSL